MLLLFLLGIVVLIQTLFEVNKVNQHTVNQRHITLGAWTQGLFDAKKKQLHPEKLVEFQKLIKKNVSIAHYYRGWESLSDPKLIQEFATLRSHGWEPMLNVNPYYYSECPPTELPLYQAIAQGKCDAFLHKAGKNLSKVNQPFFLLFAWEMNNKDLEWSIPYSGGTPSDFVAAWRHIHTIFKEEHANNVVWVFCPNVPDVSDLSYQSLYPGDNFVDWVGLDGYNWGTTQSWSQWASFSGVFTSSYNTITKIAPTKPVMIAEVNTTDQGGDKAAWYTQTFTQEIPNNFPKIDAVVIFNEDKSKEESVNWKVDVTSQTLAAFIQAIHTPWY